MQDPAGKRRRYRHVRRLYRPFVNRYVALSHHLEDYLEQQVGIPPDAISQIYNGVDTERFRPSRGGRPAIPGCPFGEPGLVAGRDRGPNGGDQGSAESGARVRPSPGAAIRRPRGNCDWSSSATARCGPRRSRCWSGPGYAERVWFAGERADVPDIMRGLDCFVLPSLAEGVSNTILEAMATGLPVVATRVGGNSELIESGMTGTLVPPANSDALAHAMLGYFHDRMTARRHAKAAYRVVEARFSLARMVADYARVYERALAAAGMPGAAGRQRARAPSAAFRGHANCSQLRTDPPCAASSESWTFRARGRSTAASSSRMNETQHHRGPDEVGLHIEPGVGLGHGGFRSSISRRGSSRCSTRTEASSSSSTARSTTTRS